MAQRTGKQMTAKQLNKKVKLTALQKTIEALRKETEENKALKVLCGQMDARIESQKYLIKKADEERSKLHSRLEKADEEFTGLKKSFDMIKNNYEREKNRLDLALEAMAGRSITTETSFKLIPEGLEQILKSH